MLRINDRRCIHMQRPFTRKDHFSNGEACDKQSRNPSFSEWENPTTYGGSLVAVASFGGRDGEGEGV